VFTLSGCSSAPIISEGEIPPQRTLQSVALDDAGKTQPIDQYDPIEGFNRGVYRFNAWFDDAIFLPLVGAYDFLLPDVVQKGVHNFMNNVGDLGNLLNSALQLNGKATAHTAGRLTVNTTVGLLGLWDPATKMGLQEYDEDFGQTLGHYGVGPGPYLVLPVFGPSSLRDTTGLVVDAYIFNELDTLYFDSNEDAWEIAYRVLNAVDTRKNIGFRYYDTGSPFEYELMRMLYLKKRKLEIAR
jgi:phospholipid-binding lipoprotein MlaA